MSDSVSTPVLVIGNKAYSSWSLRPWLLLRQFGIEFTEQRIPLDTPRFEAEIGQWSPTRRVPVLRHEDRVIWDSLAICEYVNERFLDGHGWPVGIGPRALARAAACEMHSGFQALRTQLPMNTRRSARGNSQWDAAAERDIARVQQLWTDLHRTSGSGGEFLLGRFGIVDAMFAPVALRFRGYGVELDQFAQRYCATLLALPALQTWLAEAAAEPEHIAATDSR